MIKKLQALAGAHSQADELNGRHNRDTMKKLVQQEYMQYHYPSKLATGCNV